MRANAVILRSWIDHDAPTQRDSHVRGSRPAIIGPMSSGTPTRQER
jgi:hypothetical protein